MNSQRPKPSDAWFVRPRPDPTAAAKLVCFPHAGGAASSFHTWGKALPEVEVLAIQAPGREGRMRETPIVDSSELVARITDALEDRLDRPFFFFGHSMGALIAYEVSRELRRRGWPLPSHLYVSGRRSPTVPDVEPQLHRMPDRELIDELQRRFNGLPSAITREPELLALILPVIRADVTLLERHVLRPEAPLNVPMSAFGGDTDPQTTKELLGAWRVLGASSLTVRNFPGGHFYLHERRTEFLQFFQPELKRRIQETQPTHGVAR